MNRFIKIALSLFVMVAMIASCKKSTSNDSTYGVTFEASINSRATDTAFESGDEISVTAYNSDKTVYASNAKYRYYSDNIFSSLSPIIFSSDQQSLSYRALYPYIELTESGVIEFEVYDDQSIDENYTLSDLMSSYVATTDSSSPTLNFSHLLSKVILNITSEDTEMINLVATLNLATKVEYNIFTLSSATATTKNVITMDDYGTCGFRAIVVPQTVTAGEIFGTVTVAGVPYEITFENDKTLYAGREYEFSLYISNGGISFEIGSITDWEDGNALTLSEINASSYPSDSYSWSITDEEASSDDFAGLREALEAVRSDLNTAVTLSFPNLKCLPSEALQQCLALTEISLPKAESVESYALNGCSNLANISAPVATTIGENSLYGCASLSTLSLDEATTISNYALYGCTSLTNLTLDKVTTIGEYAFVNCPALTTISLPSTTSIGKGVFDGSNITNISLPSLLEVGELSFNSCSSLTTLSLTEATDIGDGAFKECTNLTTISLPQATKLGNSALWSCTSLTTVSLASATELGNYTFWGCTSLKSADLPMVNTSGASLFFGCSTLDTVSLPSLSSLDDSTFTMCSNLQSLEIASTTGVTLTALGSGNLFSYADVSSVTLTIGIENKDLISDLYYITVASATYGPFKEIVTK